MHAHEGCSRFRCHVFDASYIATRVWDTASAIVVALWIPTRQWRSVIKSFRCKRDSVRGATRSSLQR